MGYTTDFTGSVQVLPPLNATESAYLRKFAGTRRMARDRGPYFVDGRGDFGQGRDEDVRDFNTPPAGQPGLWCQWVPTEVDGRIEWDGGEKFHNAVAWMRYLIDHFLKPGAQASNADDPQFADFTFDHVVNGHIDAEGEDSGDVWRLVVRDNVVSRVNGVITYPET